MSSLIIHFIDMAVESRCDGCKSEKSKYLLSGGGSCTGCHDDELCRRRRRLRWGPRSRGHQGEGAWNLNDAGSARPCRPT